MTGAGNTLRSSQMLMRREILPRTSVGAWCATWVKTSGRTAAYAIVNLKVQKKVKIVVGRRQERRHCQSRPSSEVNLCLHATHFIAFFPSILGHIVAKI